MKNERCERDVTSRGHEVSELLLLMGKGFQALDIEEGDRANLDCSLAGARRLLVDLLECVDELDSRWPERSPDRSAHVHGELLVRGFEVSGLLLMMRSHVESANCRIGENDRSSLLYSIEGAARLLDAWLEAVEDLGKVGAQAAPTAEGEGPSGIVRLAPSPAAIDSCGSEASEERARFLVEACAGRVAHAREQAVAAELMLRGMVEEARLSSVRTSDLLALARVVEPLRDALDGLEREVVAAAMVAAPDGRAQAPMTNECRQQTDALGA